MPKTTLTSTYVRRYINRLHSNTIFSTKEVLQYGTRTAIDKTLSRLVKSGRIIRIARGLFRREDYNIPMPALAEIAKCKANVFDKKIIAKDSNTNNTTLLNRTSTTNNTQTIYLTNGRSSSFYSGNTVITLKGISPRKFKQLKPDTT